MKKVLWGVLDSITFVFGSYSYIFIVGFNINCNTLYPHIIYINIDNIL